MDVEKEGNASDAEKKDDASVKETDIGASGEEKGDSDDDGDDRPKRKLLSDIDANAPKASPEKKARIQKKAVDDDDDSSDEEVGLDTQPPPGNEQGKNRLAFGDEDEDED
jgi:hypothetical protein